MLRVIDLEGTVLVGLLLSLIDKLIGSCFVELAVSGETLQCLSLERIGTHPYCDELAFCDW